MKNLSLKPFTALLFLALLTSMMSCKKDASSPSTKVKLLTSGSWTLKDYQKKNSSGTWVSENSNPYQFTITIYSNNTYTELNTGVVAAWSANSDFTQITFAEGTKGFGTFRVVTLTSSSLQLENLNPSDDELYVYSH